MLALILLVAALIVFILAALGVTARINLIAVGLALITLVFIIDRWPKG